MNPLPPPPPGQGGQPPGNYRQGSVPERQFEATLNEGRNSPQPSASDRDAGGDPEKAMKELGMPRPHQSAREARANNRE